MKSESARLTAVHKVIAAIVQFICRINTHARANWHYEASVLDSTNVRSIVSSLISLS